jgi:hypothetical protein
VTFSKQNNPNNIQWKLQIMKFLILYVSSSSFYFLLNPNVFFITLFWGYLNLCFFLMREARFHTHVKQEKLIFYILVLVFL